MMLPPPFAIAQHLSASLLNLSYARSLPQLLESAVTEVQSLLDCDRVIVYQLTEPNWGTIIAEALRPPASVSLHHQIQDICFQPSDIPQSTHMINDVSQESFSPCYLNLLDHFQIKSYLLNPLQPHGQPLWGWLMAHHCDRPRAWTPEQQDVSQKLAEYLSLRLNQLFEHQHLSNENQELRTQLEHQAQLLAQQGHALQSLQQTERWQQHILGHINEAAVIVDGRGHVLYWSPQAETLYNIDAEQIIGQPLATYCQVLEPSPLHDAHPTSFPQDNWRRTVITRRQDGQKLWVEVWAQRLASSPSPERSPTPAAWLATLRPIQDPHLLQVAPEPQLEEFSLIVKSAPRGATVSRSARGLSLCQPPLVSNHRTVPGRVSRLWLAHPHSSGRSRSCLSSLGPGPESASATDLTVSTSTPRPEPLLDLRSLSPLL